MRKPDKTYLYAKKSDIWHKIEKGILFDTYYDTETTDLDKRFSEITQFGGPRVEQHILALEVAVRDAVQVVSIPVVASGGASTADDVLEFVVTGPPREDDSTT